MIQRLRLAAAFAAAISLLVLAGPARAQAAGTAFTAGTGQHPDVAVDAAGTAHVVWLQPSGSTNVVAYCRVPRGQRACTGTQTFALDLEDITGRPWVFVNGATVTIVDHRCCNDETFALTSSDGGKTFGPPVPIGTGEPNGDGRLGPDGAFYGVSTITTGGTVFQRMPLSGPQATARANVGPGYEVGGAIAFLGGLPLVAFATISSTPTVAFARWSGTGDPNDASTWTAPALVGPGDSTRLAEGPSGTFLMSQTGAPGRRQYQVRRFTGSAFGGPSPVGGAEDGFENDLAEDGGGALHAVWRRNGSPATVRYAFSANGPSWQPAIDLVHDGEVFGLTAAAAPDHQGWVVWDQNSRTGEVRVAPLQYASGATKETSVTVGTDVVTLETPKGCVSGKTLVARLSVRSKKREGHVVVKVSRVDFSVDGHLRVRDTHAPFRATIVLRNLAPHSKHQLRARASLRIHHGPKRFRSIRTTFQICG